VRLVVDASVAVKWVVSEAGSDAADALLDQDLMAPALWLAEAANVLWRKVRTGEITAVEANARLSELRKAPVASLSMEPYLDQAFALAVEMGHPVYDCIYLAVALHHRTHVVTADRRFVFAASSTAHAGSVRLLTA